MRQLVAFIGGLDLCDGRYDTSEHSLFHTLNTVHSEDFHQACCPNNGIKCGGTPAAVAGVMSHASPAGCSLHLAWTSGTFCKYRQLMWAFRGAYAAQELLSLRICQAAK